MDKIFQEFMRRAAEEELLRKSRGDASGQKQGWGQAGFREGSFERDQRSGWGGESEDGGQQRYRQQFERAKQQEAQQRYEEYLRMERERKLEEEERFRRVQDVKRRVVDSVYKGKEEAEKGGIIKGVISAFKEFFKK